MNNEKGFAVVDVMIAIVLISMFLPMIAMYAKTTNESITQKAVASQMRDVLTGVESYIKANYTTLAAAATNTHAEVVPFADLISGNFLPPNYNSVNPWGQAYGIYVLQPSANDLQVFILTSGGRSHSLDNIEFGNRLVPQAAAMIGAKGGYVPTGILAGESDTELRGAYAGWTYAFSTADIPNPGPGHIAAQLYYSQGTAQGDYLYRVQVPGKPELNAMATELDMTGHTINMGDGDVGGGDDEGIARLNFEEHSVGDFTCTASDDDGGSVFYERDNGLYICRNGQLELVSDTGNATNIKNIQISHNGGIIGRPACPSNLPNPKIFVWPIMASQDDTFKPMQAIQSWATALDPAHPSYPGWEVHMRVQTRDGWMNPNASYGRLMVATQCDH